MTRSLVGEGGFAFAGIVTFGFACVAIFIAATVSGFIVPATMKHMLAKVIVHGSDRADALSKLRSALADTELFGIETNLSYLRQVCDSGDFAIGGLTTSFLKGFRYHRRAIEVLEPGTQTTIQDCPGRLGYWHAEIRPAEEVG